MEENKFNILESKKKTQLSDDLFEINYSNILATRSNNPTIEFIKYSNIFVCQNHTLMLDNHYA
jgi:hypothetical protein